jgi:hypothetical protein
MIFATFLPFARDRSRPTPAHACQSLGPTRQHLPGASRAGRHMNQHPFLADGTDVSLTTPAG